MTDRTKAERALAFLIHELRNEWDEHGTLVTLRKVTDRPLADVTLAALYCATRRTEQRTPACIALDGEHWRAGERLAGQTAESTYTPTAATDRQCTTHGDRIPCRGCAADAKASNHRHVEPAPERMDGESLIAWARRIADQNQTTRNQEETA